MAEPIIKGPHIIYTFDNGETVEGRVGLYPEIRDGIPSDYEVLPGPSIDGELEHVVNEHFGGVRGQVLGIKNNTDELKQKVLKIARNYSGVEHDVLQILTSAAEQCSFDEYATRLSHVYPFFVNVPSEWMFARTDVMNFFTKLKKELGLVSDSEARDVEAVMEYGIGLVLLPKDS